MDIERSLGSRTAWYAGRDFSSLVNLWASISQPRLRYTLGTCRDGRGEILCSDTLPEKALYPHL
jgi:hypothetical protein